MNGCKRISDDYLCPLKFAFSLIKSNPSKPIQFAGLIFLITLVAGVIIVVASAISGILGILLGAIAYIIIGLMVSSHFIYVAKLFTKDIDEAIETYKKTPISKSFDDLGTALGIVVGLFIVFFIMGIISLLLSYLHLSIILNLFIMFLSPMVMGHVLTSNSFQESFFRSFYYFNVPLIKLYLNTRYLILAIIYIATSIVGLVIFYIGIMIIALPFGLSGLLSIYSGYGYGYGAGNIVLLIIGAIILLIYAVIYGYFYVILLSAFDVASIYYKKEG